MNSAQTLRTPTKTSRQYNNGVHSAEVDTRLASVDTVVVLCRVAAAVLGLVIESFFEMIHASLTAGAKHQKDCIRNVYKSGIKQGLILLTLKPAPSAFDSIVNGTTKATL